MKLAGPGQKHAVLRYQQLVRIATSGYVMTDSEKRELASLLADRVTPPLDGTKPAERIEEAKAYFARMKPDEWRKAQADKQRLTDVDTLDAHARVLTGGSYWYSNDDTCGVYVGGHPELSWHHHAHDENAARHSVAEHIRATPRCGASHPGLGRCIYLAGHPGEDHTYRDDETDTPT